MAGMENLILAAKMAPAEVDRASAAAKRAGAATAGPHAIRRGDAIVIGGVRRRVADVRPGDDGSVTVDLEQLAS